MIDNNVLKKGVSIGCALDKKTSVEFISTYFALGTSTGRSCRSGTGSTKTSYWNKNDVSRAPRHCKYRDSASHIINAQ
jgi:hypothetical protein